MLLTELPSSKKLEAHRKTWDGVRMETLLKAETGRFQRFSLELDDLLLDFSKNLIDAETHPLRSVRDVVMLFRPIRLGDRHVEEALPVRRLKKWHIRVPDFKVQVLGFGVGYPGILTGLSGSAKVAV